MGYFRGECRVHASKAEFLRGVVREYFGCLRQSEHAGDFEELLLDRLKEKKDINTFFLQLANDNDMRIKESVDASLIGIHGELPEWFTEILPDFIGFTRWPVYDYFRNRYIFHGNHQHDSASRSKASKVIADLYGASSLIPQTRYICLQTGNITRLGVSVDPSPGISPDSITDTSIKVSPEFQRQTLILNMLDVICLQNDHATYNYLVIPDDDNVIYSLSAFDNDNTGAFSVSFSPIICNDHESALITEEGLINRPFLDKENTMNILKTPEKRICEALNDFMPRLAIYALCVRVRKLQKAITKSLLAGTLRLLNKEEFSPFTMREELSGKYGVTYLKHFMDKYNTEIAT